VNSKRRWKTLKRLDVLVRLSLISLALRVNRLDKRALM
jgi:hypothetical protein